jgi:4-amino-4-deoxy-L-arabinose transferase-like glycosyltransferase
VIPESEQRFYALFAGQEVTPPEDRLPFDELRLTRPVELWRHGDQMTQHPPLYYAVSAGVVRGLGALDWPFDRALWLMRLVSVAMVMWLPLLAFATVRTLTGDRRLADVASLLPLAVPQLASLGGSVQNDALVILLGGVATMLLSRVLRGDRSWRTLLLVAVTLGLALVTKGSLLLLVPVVGLAVVVGLRRAAALRWPATLVRLAAVWGVAFVVGGWWWALNLVRYGTVQPEGIAIPVTDAPGSPRSSLGEFAGIFWERITTSFWGCFGLLELPLARAVVVVLTVGTLVLVGLSLRRSGLRLALGVLLSLLVLTAALVFWQTYQDHLATGVYGGLQGRYLYGGLVPLFAAMAVGLGTLGRENGRLRAWLPAVLLPLVLVTAAYGLWVGFSGFYLELDWSLGSAWGRMVGWSPWSDAEARALVGVLVALSLVALGVAVRSARRADPRRNGDPGTDRREPPRAGTLSLLCRKAGAA